MNNQMLHRGFLARLTSTMNILPVFSTCLLLLVQFQIFHALPTSSSSLNSGLQQQQNTQPIITASSPSTAYGSAYPYSSYRPGARLEDSYRPYTDPGTSASLYVPEAAHPNSIYSRQSAASSKKNLNKLLQFIEKDIEAGDLQERQQLLESTPDDKQENTSPEKMQISSPTHSNNNNNNNTPIPRNNKPRLLPLPPVQQQKPSSTFLSSGTPTSTFSEINNNNNKALRQQGQHQNYDPKSQQQQQPSAAASTSSPTVTSLSEEQRSRSVDFSPVPPPFAPELDPQYETRQYGLGALSLLDQAGPFW